MSDLRQPREVPCSLCGEPVVLPAEAELEPLIEAGVAVVHPDGCAAAAAARPLVTYSVTIQVRRRPRRVGAEWELLAQCGGQADSPTLAEAMPKLTTVVNDQWQKIGKMAAVAEEGEDGE